MTIAGWYSGKARSRTGWLALIVRCIPLDCTTITHLLGTVMPVISNFVYQLVNTSSMYTFRYVPNAEFAVTYLHVAKCSFLQAWICGFASFVTTLWLTTRPVHSIACRRPAPCTYQKGSQNRRQWRYILQPISLLFLPLILPSLNDIGFGIINHKWTHSSEQVLRQVMSPSALRKLAGGTLSESDTTAYAETQEVNGPGEIEAGVEWEDVADGVFLLIEHTQTKCEGHTFKFRLRKSVTDATPIATCRAV